MAKKKKRSPQPKSTKRQLSRWQKKKRQRIILGVAIFILVAVLGTVGVPWYLNQYRPLHQTVIRVNDTEFNMKYYVEMLKLYGTKQDTNVVKDIEQNELIRQEALKLGINVSDDEVREELKRSNLPVNDATRDLVRSRILIEKLRDEYFEKEVPVFTEQRHVMAMLLESESQVAEVRARIEAGEEFAELAGELSLESLSKEQSGDLGWRPKNMLTILLGTSVIDEYVFSSEVGVLSQPIHDGEIIKDMGYWIAKVLEREVTPEEAKVLGILLGSEEEAQWVRDKLEAGGDFGELAEVLSEHEESNEDGGKLGWFTPGEAGPAFDEFVFNPEVELGVVSEPIFDDDIVTEGGYWLIKVLKKKEKKEKDDIQVILLGSKEEAQRVRSRLDVGEDFGELAKELSQHDKSKEKEGKLTGITSSKMSPALDEFIFNSELELEVVSEPIRDGDAVTKGGYWLIQVIDKDNNRQIEDSDRDLLKARALEDWIEALWDDPENTVENYLDSEKEAWAIKQAKGR